MLQPASFWLIFLTLIPGNFGCKHLYIYCTTTTLTWLFVTNKTYSTPKWLLFNLTRLTLQLDVTFLRATNNLKIELSSNLKTCEAHYRSRLQVLFQVSSSKVSTDSKGIYLSFAYLLCFSSLLAHWYVRLYCYWNSPLLSVNFWKRSFQWTNEWNFSCY